MACKHERLQCVNNVFFCLDCGARIEREARADKQQPALEEKTQEGPKKAKRTAVKKEDK